MDDIETLEPWTDDGALWIPNSTLADSTNVYSTLGEPNNHPPLPLPLPAYVAILILMSLVGFVGNTLVIAAVLTNKRLRVMQNTFIINLSVADLLVVCIDIPFLIQGAVDKGALLRRWPGLCNFVATVNVTCCVCSIWSITSVAVNRYIAICHRLTYPSIYNKRTIPLMIVGIWLWAFMVDLPNYIGWGIHIFDTRNFQCNWDYSYNLAFTRGYVIPIGFFIPLSVITYSYVRIFMHVRKSSRRLQQFAKDPLSKRRFHGINSTDIKLLKTVGVIGATFTAMWTPYALTAFFNQGNRWLLVFSTLLGLSNSSLNFFIYAFNKSFRVAYAQIFKTIFCCKTKSDIPEIRVTESSYQSE